MITGVTKGFEYKMKVVYAHFPTNIQIEKGPRGPKTEVDIVNFIGQKVKFHVSALDGVTVDKDTKNNNDIVIQGNDIENVSRTCALISQKCAVRNKDIRKFLDGVYVSSKGNVVKD